MYKIGQLSKLTNVSVPTIRFYEQKGLLCPLNVDKWTGYRYYDDSSVARLKEIAYFKSLGFSLDEICNLDEQTIKNKLIQTKQNLAKLSKNINILSSFNKTEGGNMKKSEIVKEVLKQLEENHLNLYHDASKERVHKFAEHQDWDSFNELEFDYFMLKLFSKFNDSQTEWRIRYLKLDKCFRFINDEIYLHLFNDKKMIKVSKIAGKTPSRIVEELKALLPYETSERFTCLCEKALNNGYVYKLLGLLSDEQLSFLTEDGLSHVAKIIAQPTTNTITRSPYEYRLLDNNILYIRYRSARPSKDYPFSQFAEDIEKKVKEKNITKYILDARNNGGGNSELFNPLYNVIEDNNLKGVVIADSFTYGAAVFNIAKLKTKYNAVIVGEPLGASTIRYGETRHLKVGDYSFSVALKLFDLSDAFGYKGTIQPDIIAPFSLEDFHAGKDTQLEQAITILKE